MSTPSLLRLFEPPEDYDGLFGWVCGFSADAGFLDAAAERFTRKSSSSRASNGQLVLGVMLDPFHEQISLLDVPGVADLPLRTPPGEAFRLMHAKIALLGFRDRSQGWRLRVIVSTGNWTQQTLEDSLDLAWCFDVDGAELGQGDETLVQRCADVAKASEILDWVGGHYDRALIELAARDSETSLAARELARWAALCASQADTAKPRIFDNRERPLLEGLLGNLRKHVGGIRRNLIALGSGFFEADGGGGVPRAERLNEEFGRRQGGFARLMYGKTPPSTRRLLQLAFNRHNSFPRVLVAQSVVGREGLNLHRACRKVVLLHPEWNPGVVEQQIGRVDRLGSYWEHTLAEVERQLAESRGEVPRIEILPVIFKGTYDEHNWAVLRRRWDDLRAQLHGVVIPPSSHGDDPELGAPARAINARAPDFSPRGEGGAGFGS